MDDVHDALEVFLDYRLKLGWDVWIVLGELRRVENEISLRVLLQCVQILTPDRIGMLSSGQSLKDATPCRQSFGVSAVVAQGVRRRCGLRRLHRSPRLL